MFKLHLSRGGVWCGLAYAAMFLLLARVLRDSFGFPLDDSWIHQVVARNLAEYKVLGFIPGQLTAGSTSPFWTLILAFRVLIFPALSPIIYCAALSVILFAAIGYVLKSLMEKDGLAAGPSWCFALAPAASGNFLWFGLLGMEHILFIFLSLCIIRVWWMRTGHGLLARRIVLPALCLLLVLTRPEGIFVLAPLFIFRRAAGRTYPDWFFAVVGAACGGCVSAAVNWMTGHHLTPLTMQGRSGVLPASDWLTLRLEFLGHAFARLLSVWGIEVPQQLLHGRAVAAGVLLAAVLGCWMFLAVLFLIRAHAGRTLLLCAWGGVIGLLYLLMLPTTSHGGRYIAIPVMLFLPLVFLGVFRMGTRWLDPARALILVGALAAGTATASMIAWSSAGAADIQQINTEHGEMAEWMERHLPPDAIPRRQIAVFDIGRIGYQLGGNLIDLGGLVDYRFQRYLVTDTVTDYLRQLNVRYVVLPGVADPLRSDYSSGLGIDGKHGVGLTLVHASCADPEIASLAFTSSEAAMPCQRLYSVRYLGSGDS